MNNSPPDGGCPESQKSPLERSPAACPLEGRGGSAADGATPRIPSHELFGGGRRIIIEHGGREYSLLITRQGKLVLNRC